jgi:hypothetical protein
VAVFHPLKDLPGSGAQMREESAGGPVLRIEMVSDMWGDLG